MRLTRVTSLHASNDTQDKFGDVRKRAEKRAPTMILSLRGRTWRFGCAAI